MSGVGSSLASKSARSESTRDFPSALATKSRTARTYSGTAGIVTLWRNSAADIKDTDPPWPAPAPEGHRAAADAGRMDLHSARRVKPPAAPSAQPEAPASPSHTCPTMPIPPT